MQNPFLVGLSLNLEMRMADIKNLDLSGIARGTFGSVRSY